MTQLEDGICNLDAMLIDTHIHTMKGGADSSLSLSELVEEAKRLRLDGVCLTEHNVFWDRHEFQAFTRDEDILIIRAVELETELGHIIVFGLDKWNSGMHRAETLRRVVESEGGFMIAAHPFRRFFDRLYPGPYWGKRPRSVEEAAKLPLFSLVDAIEVANGCNTDRENAFAFEVAKSLGMNSTGGSDAHSTYGIGCFVTVFEKHIKSQEEFLQELKAGGFYPAIGLRKGYLVPYEPEEELDLPLPYDVS